MEVRFISVSAADLSNVECVPGQLIALNDAPGFYYDMGTTLDKRYQVGAVDTQDVLPETGQEDVLYVAMSDQPFRKQGFYIWSNLTQSYLPLGVNRIKGTESEYRSGDVEISKADIGLSNVDNLSRDSIVQSITPVELANKFGGNVVTDVSFNAKYLSGSELGEIIVHPNSPESEPISYTIYAPSEGSGVVEGLEGTAPIHIEKKAGTSGIYIISHDDAPEEGKSIRCPEADEIVNEPGFDDIIAVPEIYTDDGGHVSRAESTFVRIPGTLASEGHHGDGASKGLVTYDEWHGLNELITNFIQTRQYHIYESDWESSEIPIPEDEGPVPLPKPECIFYITQEISDAPWKEIYFSKPRIQVKSTSGNEVYLVSDNFPGDVDVTIKYVDLSFH